MKRFFALCLVLGLLTGCAQRVDAPQTTTPPTISESTTSEPTIPEGIALEQLVGSWMLSNDKNDFDTLRSLFGSSLSQGNGLTIGSDGSIQYFIGAGAGGTGTFTYEEEQISATIVNFVEKDTETLEFKAALEDGKLYLHQTLYDTPLTWEKGSPAPSTAEEETQLAQPGTQEPTQPAPQASGTEADFAEVLNAYKEALDAHWDIGTYYEKGLNAQVGAVNDESLVGYTLRDVDEDGKMELLIGCCNEPNIYAIYKMGSSEMIIDAHDRSSFYLEPDNVIVNRASNSATQGAYLIYFLKNGSLSLNVGVLWDYQVNTDAPYFYTRDLDWDTSNDEKISNSHAESVIKAYESNYVMLDYKPFSIYSAS